MGFDGFMPGECYGNLRYPINFTFHYTTFDTDPLIKEAGT